MHERHDLEVETVAPDRTFTVSVTVAEGHVEVIFSRGGQTKFACGASELATAIRFVEKHAEVELAGAEG